jgi:phytanoyl-CoA hydroxylase
MQLTPEQRVQFAEEGYLLLRGALDDSDLDPVIAEYEAHIAHRAEQFMAAGTITDLHADKPFDRRLVEICRENDAIYENLDIMHFRGRASFEFLHNEHLLDIVEGLVGPEITCSPVQHTRAKLPAGLTPSGGDPHLAPWHQDAGAYREEADPHDVLTVWLPLSPARPENGCMQIIPRMHRAGLIEHYIQQGLVTIDVDEDSAEQEPLALPMDRGDLLLMHKSMPHRSTPNNTDTVRWSMDLRYQQTGTPSGRPYFPDFVVRSRSHPDTPMRDYDEWCRLWVTALEEAKQQKTSSYRWKVMP